MKEIDKAKFEEKFTDIKKIEKKLNFEISKDQEIIEYSPSSFEYLKDICGIIKKNNGGILIIDYGYLSSKMHETLQAVNNHKHSNVLEDIGDSDITYNINFNLFNKFIDVHSFPLKAGNRRVTISISTIIICTSFALEKLKKPSSP